MIAEQINIFEISRPKYKIKKPIRLIELFAGIGSQAKALKNIGANFEHYRAIDFDKYAIKSYNAIHETNFEPLDITKITAKDLNIVNTDKYEYIMTYSFPCQDLSLAGKGAGMSKGENTRSGLLWEVERLLKECNELPQILLMENVPQVIGKKNLKDFMEWQLFLEKLGYSNYFELLNAKNYGIPQNRNRCFMISILGDYYYQFPRKQKLKYRLKDFLEDEVDEKYYLSKDNYVLVPEATKKSYAENGGVVVKGNYSPSGHNASRIVDQNGLAPTVMENHGTVTAIVEEKTLLKTQLANKLIEEKKVKPFDVIRHSYSQSRIENERIECNNVSPTLDTRCDCLGVVVNNTKNVNLRIRKLTPKECWRLVGFSDEDFEKAEKVNSNSQLYKQAGNAIVVQVLEAVFKEFF